MGLFQRRPQLSDPVNYVTVGQNKTLLVVGLGNIGKKYDNTRHNIGFAVADQFVAKNPDLGNWTDKKDLKCLFASGRLGESRVIVIKPTTLMNLSGQAVAATANFYRIPPGQILVLHDELDIDFGQLRTRVGGSAAGHNGIKSIIEQFGEDFARLRIGIGPKKPAQIDSADFVLAKFSPTEAKQIPQLLRETTAMLSEYVYGAGNLTAETRSFLI